MKNSTAIRNRLGSRQSPNMVPQYTETNQMQKKKRGFSAADQILRVKENVKEEGEKSIGS